MYKHKATVLVVSRLLFLLPHGIFTVCFKFMCVHAGLTNALFMKEGGSLLQLLPYGWEIEPGKQLRSAFSQDIPAILGGQYFQVGCHLCTPVSGHLTSFVSSLLQVRLQFAQHAGQ